MHAIILAGGAGTRLRPLTRAIRKELVPVVNVPLLEYRLRNLSQHGVEHVIIACAAGVREIEGYFGDGSALGIHLHYNYEDRPLGSGRAVKEAARAFGTTGTLVVCNGDIITNVDLTAMIGRHRDTRATLSMSLARVQDPWDYGVAETDRDLRIRSFVEKPSRGTEPSDLINAGTWLWEPKMLDRIPDDESAVVDQFSERVLFPGVIADGHRVQGFTEDLWVDVGSPERYLLATRLLLERMTAQTGADVLAVEEAEIAPTAELEGPIAIGPGARVEEGARIIGPAVLGSSSVVGANAVLDRSVLWERASIGDGSRVSGSIVARAAFIGRECVVTDAVLADSASIGDGAMPDANLRLDPGTRA